MTNREEFETLRKRLFELADKMGMRIEIVVKRKRPVVYGHPPLDASSKRASPEPNLGREPGDE